MILNRKNILLDPAPNEGGTPPAAPAAAPAIPAGHIALAEHNNALEKVRREEKDKLYPKITELETQITTLKTALTAAETKVAEVTSQLTAIGKAKTASGEIDVNKLVEEVAERAATGAQKKVEAELAALRARSDQMENRNKVLEIETLRKTLIEENGGPDKLVVELVRGNSEQELRDSVVSSKAAFDRIQAKLGGSTPPPSTANNQGQANAGGQAGPGAPPTLPGSGVPGGESGAVNGSVQSMDMKDYAARRNALKQATVGRYAGVR